MTAQDRVYLDHNATAPLRPEARAAMLAALDLPGNAASVHGEGRRCRGLIETAREQVAALVGAEPDEVVFTSGATEANNWVMRAGWSAITTSAIEHESVLAPARASGAALNLIGCDADGAIVGTISPFSSPASSRRLAFGTKRHLPREGGGKSASDVPALLSLQLANSETGVLQPVAEIAAAWAGTGTIFHTDAVQAVGRIAVDFKQLSVDLMSISAHKIGGPQGVGALIIRSGVDLPALMLGGGQQRRRRSGTENVAGIAAFGAAARAAKVGLAGASEMARLRDRLEAAVLEMTPDCVIVGASAPRLPNTSCIAVPGEEAATLLIQLDLAGIAVSAGSACSSGRIGASHVLAAMGLDDALARAAIRVSLGPTTTTVEIDRFVAAWRQVHRGRNSRIIDASSLQAGPRPALASA